ncbi:MAG: hypothetical protein ACI4A3_08955 [Lachnospiraceae bacterium]
MDENYLDNLLNEFSLDKEIDHKIEDELDNEMQEEKRKRKEEHTLSQEDAFNLDLEQDVIGEALDGDLHFTEEQMDELDQLDNLADLDIGDLDFSDIDFDDLDMMKLENTSDHDFDDILKDFEGNLEIDDFFDEKKSNDLKQEETLTEAPKMDDESESIQPEKSEPEVSGLESASEETALEDDALSDKTNVVQTSEENGDLNADNFDADSFLDSLLEAEEEEKAAEQPIVELPEEQEEDTAAEFPEEQEEDTATELPEEAAADLAPEPVSNESEEELVELSSEENDELDDLFSMLDLQEDSDAENVSEPEENQSGESEEPILAELEDIEELEEEPVKKKRSFVQILFGDPDEDDELSEEELAAAEAKKAAKKAKKEAAKAAKAEKKEAAKAEKELKDSQKKKEDAEKKRIHAEKKAKRKAEELANAEPEKKLNKPMVIFIFSVFLGGTFLFYMASNNFNYKLAIEKAADYFASQKYHRAYDEIKGVDVKEEDQDLKDRIYTVMYVERLYEAYENNIELGRQKKALDSLLRGVDKYYEYYEEAERLGIISDLDYSFSRIQNTLLENYGITVEQAVEINKLEDYEYVQTIDSYTAAMQPEAE